MGHVQVANGADVYENLRRRKLCVDGSCTPRTGVILHATPRRLVNVGIKAIKLRYTCVKKSR